MKANKRPRMTKLDIRMVVEEIESWARGERGKKLSWIILERIFPFTRQTMASKNLIKTVYEKARYSTRETKPSKNKSSDYKTGDLEIMRLKKRIKELEMEKEVLLKLWVKDFL